MAKLLRPLVRAVTSQIESKYAPGIAFDSVQAGWYLRQGYPTIYSILTGGAPAWSGESVSVETALNHSVVWACNRIISESIGFIPAVLMQRKAGAHKHAEGHPMYNAMQFAPNPEISAQGFTEMLTSHCLLQGNAYAKIVRRSSSGTAIELIPLIPSQVFPDRERDGRKRLIYVVREPGQPDTVYTVDRSKPHDILHIRGLGWDGVRGYSVITMGRQSLGTAIASERNLARFWANGGRIPYLLEMARKFKTDEDFQKFRNDWEQIYAEPHRAPILEDGITYKPIGTTMRDAQGIEFRQFEVSEICRWFSVSPHLVQDLSKATFSNVEHLAMDFVRTTLNSWMWRWQQDFWRCVLTDEEKSQGYYLDHDAYVLLRGDIKTRMEAYASALQNGHMSIDEVRALEGRNPLPEKLGDKYHIQLNMQELGKPVPRPEPKPAALAEPKPAPADEPQPEDGTDGEADGSTKLRRIV
jgi:HK97 family phage portal protein